MADIFVKPERATEILELVLPSQIMFYRVPINDPESEIVPLESTPDQAQRSASPAAAALEAASAPARSIKPDLRTIFGSVSTADMAESIKALLAAEEEGTRVVVGAEDISILNDEQEGTGIEGDRLKALGQFEVQVRVKGGEAVQRTVCVLAQDES